MKDRSMLDLQDSSTGGRHAVVVGGSIGGMLAARVLADHFDRVTIVERDQLPEGSENRPGVPQARHLHFLFKRGLMVAEELFPGITADLTAQGSHLLDQGSDFRILYRSGWSPRKEIGLEFCTFTRPLLEATVRRHLMANPKVVVRQGFEVSRLVMDESKARVTGVGLRSRHRDPNVPVEEYKKEWKTLFVMNRPPYQPRAGIIQPIEGNRWIVTIAGVMHDYPPTDEEGFLQFARSLSTPELYRAIQHAKPLSRIWGYRRTENRLRSYEKTRLPAGFAALGDSVCAFNPVYGLGMTLIGLEAMELGKCLREGRGTLDNRRFQKRVSKLVAGPWALTTGEDLRWPSTQGGKINAKVKFMHWYIDQVIRLIPLHEEVFRRFQEVNHMLKSPAALFHPAVLRRVLRQAFGPQRVFVPKPQEAPARVSAARATSTVAVRR